MAILALALLFSESTLFAHGSEHHNRRGYGHVKGKKIKKVRREPEHSRFSLSLGLSASQTFANSAGSQGQVARSNYSLLHEGEDHSGESPDTPTTSTGSETLTVLSAKASYEIMPDVDAFLMAGYYLSDGIADPSLGAQYNFEVGNIGSFAALSASIPASDASQKLYKITTVTLAGGPMIPRKKWTLALTATLAASWYYKTVIVDDVEGAMMAPKQNLSSRLHGDEDHDHTSASSSSIPEDGETGDREFFRYGLKTGLNYKWTRKLKVDNALGAAYVSRQFGTNTWVTDATVAQLTYLFQPFSVFGGLSLRGEAAGPSVPSKPTIGVGAEYLIN